MILMVIIHLRIVEIMNRHEFAEAALEVIQRFWHNSQIFRFYSDFDQHNSRFTESKSKLDGQSKDPETVILG
jgi:hypothetical protein